FQGGVIHWSPATGAHITKGAIDAAWAGLNWENGFLGYPTSNEITGLKNGGVYQTSSSASSTGPPVRGPTPTRAHPRGICIAGLGERPLGLSDHQ
ncbi:conserved hypothetical protein, partial [Arthrobacter sp. Hiyo6]